MLAFSRPPAAVVLLAMSLFGLGSCGSKDRQGSIHLGLAWNGSTTEAFAGSQVPTEVTTITFTVLNSVGEQALATDGGAIYREVAATDKVTRIDSVAAGNGYSLVVNGLDSSRSIIYAKTQSQIEVFSGRTTQLGVLRMDKVSDSDSSTGTDSSGNSGTGAGDSTGTDPVSTLTTFNALGSGTEADPFQIEAFAQLQDLAANGCNATVTTSCDVHLRLTRDIDYQNNLQTSIGPNSGNERGRE